MALRYVDPAAGGANNGTSWADAWTDFQSAADNCVAGDICYCRGTQTLAAIIDHDINVGTAADPIQFIGCNAAGVEDGTHFVLDGDGVAAHCLELYNAGGDYLHFRNFTIQDATSHGVAVNASSVRCYWENCLFQNNGGHGFGILSSSAIAHNFLDCHFLNNTNSGFHQPVYSHVIRCTAIGNGDHGIRPYRSSVLIYCIMHDNDDAGFYYNVANLLVGGVFHCVVDGNGVEGVDLTDGFNAFFLGNRITHNTGDGMEINAGGNLHWQDYNVVVQNTVSQISDAGGLMRGGANTSEAGAAGYVNRGADDFTTDTTAQLRREAMQVG